MQRARRSLTAQPCTCGVQPFHVLHLAGNRHSLECCPCGIRTQKFATEAQALASWSQARLNPCDKPVLRSVTTTNQGTAP